MVAGAFFAMSLMFGAQRGVFFGAVHLGLWRYRVWECQGLLQLDQGLPLASWRLGWLVRRGLADASGDVTRAGRRRAESVEAAVMGPGAVS